MPQIPLFETHNSNDSGTPKASLSWTACEPYWEDLLETRIFLKEGVRTPIENKGDVKTNVKIDFYTSSATELQIKNFTENKFIKLNGETKNSVNINTNFGVKQITSKQMVLNVINDGHDLRYVSFIESLNFFLAVGARGTIQKSVDGINWESVSIMGSYKTFSSLVYAKELNLIIAICNDGIFSSVDGETWTNSWTQNYGGTSICYSSELHLFVVVGSHSGNGHVLTSTDGITWNRTLIGIQGEFYGVTYSSVLGLFVAVGKTGLICTSPDGINWTERTSNVTQDLSSVIYVVTLGKFIAVGGGYRSSTEVTSPDGINWTEISITPSSSLKQIIYVETMNSFVAVSGGEGGGIYSSVDGEHWTLRKESRVQYAFYSVCYSSKLGMFIAVGSEGSKYTSIDEINWEQRTSEYESMLNAITYSKKLNLFIACSGEYYYYLTSHDGINWVKRYFGSAIYIYGIVYSESLGLFVAVGKDRTVAYSVDGISWTSQTLFPSEYQNTSFKSVVYSRLLNLFVLVGEDGYIFTSPNGVDWTERTSGVSADLNSITYSESLNLFVAVGGDGEHDVIITSPDGINWTTRYSEVGYYLYSVTISESLGLFVAVGSSVLVSYGGVNWTKHGSYSHESIAYSEKLGLFIAGGYIYFDTSSDGVNWVNSSSTANGRILSILYSEMLESFIMVGENGIILLSSFSLSENQISKLSEDSDMAFGLEVGMNELLVSSLSGHVNSSIVFKQKYLGV